MTKLAKYLEVVLLILYENKFIITFAFVYLTLMGCLSLFA